MNTTESRREFEEWARTNTSIGLDLDMDVDDGVEHYWNHSTYAAWEAWQAARAKQSEIICRSCGLREERGEKPSFDF
jgi:hypothetical protein